ncbi:MAG: RIP metalloprotease RseP [Marinifilaceae bacterium]|nr:RIP metalloprotease RseP [Marinifilaceae bacterium]
MEILVKIAQFVLSLSLLVICHEFGHFLFAKLFKMRVEKFYLFFNPWFSIWKKKIGETEYGIGWLPLGGYVKIAGMIDESMDTEAMKQPAKEWEFRSKPAWQRLLVMVGGVLMNVIVAFAIYIGILFAWGETYLPAENVKYGVVAEGPFAELGLKTGDKIISLDNQPVERFEGIVSDILINQKKSIQVERDGQIISIDIPDQFISELMEIASGKDARAALLSPRMPANKVLIQGFADYSAAYDAGVREGDVISAINGESFNFYDEYMGLIKGTADSASTKLTVLRNKTDIAITMSNVDSLSYDTLNIAFKLPVEGVMGVYNAPIINESYETSTKYYSLFEAIPAGIEKGIAQLGSYVRSLGLLFSTDSGYKSVGGFMTMGDIFPGLWDWESFWSLTALISIMLAVVNILPIPALDGGHVVFLLYEVITRRQPSEKFLEYAQWVGMVFLLGLFLLANINDFLKFFT